MPNPRIVIADDAAFMRNVLREVLVGHGFEVVSEAVDGAQAVDQFRQWRPDLIILDITMPILDGRQALGEILKVDPEARIVMCSALGQERIIRETLLAGACDYLVKPFSNSQILTTVRRALLKRSDRPNSVLEELVAWYEIGELVIRHGLASPQEVGAIREKASVEDCSQTLYAGLVEKGLASENDLDAFLEQGHREVSLAYFLLKASHITMEELRCSLVMMRKSGNLLATTLVIQGFCDAQHIAAESKRIPPYPRAVAKPS